MTTLTWLHLSDIHFQLSDSYDAKIVSKPLLADIEKLIKADNLKPDFITVTGDIAATGKDTEYAMARQFFEAVLGVTGLTRERLFIVPGNHDVDRKAVSILAKGAPSILNDLKSVNGLLSEIEGRSLMFQRFGNYRKFVADYFGEILPSDDEHYYYVRKFQVGGNQVAILGLNSAWMAWSDDDRNKLLLGERQVRAALDEAQGADLCLALMHHPFDWLQDFDRRICEPLLSRNCHFVLHGHMHEINLQLARTPNTDSMVIAAGAGYVSREYPNSYNFVQLDLTELSGKVYLRMYSDNQGGFWTEDVLSYDNTPGGVYAFQLPKAETFVNRLLSKVEDGLVDLRPHENFNPKVIDRLVTIIKSGFEVPTVSPSALHVRTQRQCRAFIALSRMSNKEAVNYLGTLTPAGMVFIPAGSFRMGSSSKRFDNEQPASDVWVNSFYLARFPVTNNEYSEFIKAGSYRDKRYWTYAGWLWVNAHGRREPLHWKEIPSGQGDHPVQWLSWYEAMAYARWLALISGAPYRLPTESEWEKAAGWDAQNQEKREYPWGNEFDIKRCNIKKSATAASWSVPVGRLSPGGDSPYGVADMAGQVWEWSSSLRTPYPYNPDDGRENPDADGERVFRGGSWANDDPLVARCACRYYPHLPILPYMNTAELIYEGPCGLRVALGFTEKDVRSSASSL